MIVVFLVFFMMGESSDYSKKIIGVWDADNGYVMEFMPDGIVRQGSNDKWDENGTYEIVNKKLLRLGDSYSSITNEYVYFDIEINGKTMTLCMHDDSNEKIKLIKRNK